MSTALDFDDLKSAWQQLDERLARIEALQIDARAGDRGRDRLVASVRALRPLLVGQVLQALCGTALLVYAAIFWSSNFDRVHLMLCGISLHVYGIWLVASAGQELSLLARIRFTTPVLDAQKQLATLRRWRSRNGLLFAYAGCFVWIPALLMLFAWMGADIWQHRPDVVGWFLVSGGLCAAAIHAGLRWAQRRPTSAASMRANAAGQAVRNAELALADFEYFDTDDNNRRDC